jgi:hypothetical protein
MFAESDPFGSVVVVIIAVLVAYYFLRKAAYNRWLLHNHPEAWRAKQTAELEKQRVELERQEIKRRKMNTAAGIGRGIARLFLK